MRKLLFLFMLISFVSCKKTREEMIAKKWQAIGFESESLERELEMQRNFIDTVGSSTDAATNEKLYGVRNMDSMRMVLREQFEELIEQQKTTIKNTWLDFHKDGTVISSFGSAPDTVSWYFDDGGALILDEIKKKGGGSRVKMEVLELNDTLLKLQYNENGFSSTAIFKPETK